MIILKSLSLVSKGFSDDQTPGGGGSTGDEFDDHCGACNCVQTMDWYSDFSCR